MRDLACKLIDVDLTLWPSAQQWFSVKLGLWILDKTKQSC
jgi:hypothetical protein